MSTRMRHSAIADSLTVVVTTYNRYPHLSRLLRYAESVGLPWTLHVLDSSSYALADEELTRRLAGGRIQHVVYAPSTQSMDKLRDGLNRVGSTYVVVWNDDDFLVPRALAEGIAWLEAHPEYSVAHGPSALFVTERMHGRTELGCMPYLQRPITDDTAARRLRSYLGCQTVLNSSVHRTASLVRNVALCCSHRFGYTWAELALGGLAVIEGQAAHLDRLYLLKEGHEGPDTWILSLINEIPQDQAGWREPTRRIDAFEWVADPGFAETYAKFRDCLASVLAEQDRISLDEARRVVKEAFWRYVAKVLADKWPGRRAKEPAGMSARVRTLAHQVPGLRSAWRAVSRFIPPATGVMSLRALLHPASSYHADFMPIYRAITASDAAQEASEPAAELAGSR